MDEKLIACLRSATDPGWKLIKKFRLVSYLFLSILTTNFIFLSWDMFSPPETKEIAVQQIKNIDLEKVEVSFVVRDDYLGTEKPYKTRRSKLNINKKEWFYLKNAGQDKYFPTLVKRNFFKKYDVLVDNSPSFAVIHTFFVAVLIYLVSVLNGKFMIIKTLVFFLLSIICLVIFAFINSYEKDAEYFINDVTNNTTRIFFKEINFKSNDSEERIILINPLSKLDSFTISRNFFINKNNNFYIDTLFGQSWEFYFISFSLFIFCFNHALVFF